MLKVVPFEAKPKPETQAQTQAPVPVNTHILHMLDDLRRMALTGELRQLAIAGSTNDRDVVMAYAVCPDRPDVFRLAGAMASVKLKMLNDQVEGV